MRVPGDPACGSPSERPIHFRALGTLSNGRSRIHGDRHMVKEEITIVNKLGLHARAAAKLVSLASTFASDVELEKEGRKVNAKSIMGVMMLAASKGTTLQLLVSGSDEREACRQLLALISDRFGEEE